MISFSYREWNRYNSHWRYKYTKMNVHSCYLKVYHEKPCDLCWRDADYLLIPAPNDGLFVYVSSSGLLIYEQPKSVHRWSYNICYKCTNIIYNRKRADYAAFLILKAALVPDIAVLIYRLVVQFRSN